MKFAAPIFALLFLLTAPASAQDLIIPQVLTRRLDEAILFTRQQPLGSARFMGTGGSMTALGVDATTLHTNPAGIGWNRNANASISAGFRNRGVDTRLRGDAGNQTLSTSESSFLVPNLGLVWASETGSYEFPTLNYGFSFTRLADFNESFSYEGRSSRSIIDAVVEDFIDGVAQDENGQFRANLITVIDPTVGPTELPQDVDTRPVRFDDIGFYSEFDFEDNNDDLLAREGRVDRTGSMNEIALGIGGNYDNTLLWGLSLGIPFMNFTEVRDYDERDDQNLLAQYESASFTERATMDGSGVNFKFGAVYLPSIASRISISFHSPTFWTFDETYETDFEYLYTVGTEALGGNALSPRRERQTNVRTPWRFNLGGGYIIGRNGFISTDIEYVNYKGTEFGFDDFAGFEDGVNDDIDDVLGGVFNIKVGGELNFDPVLVRLGVGYQTLPEQDARFGEDEGILSYSGGLGINLGKLFIDVAARYQGRSTYFAPYRTFGFEPNLVDTDRSRITGIVTVGFRGFN